MVHCPRCQSAIATSDVNVTTDVALCRKCDDVFKISEQLEVAAQPPVDLARPPSGAWLDEASDGFEVGATTRSPIAFFIVPFMCVWSGGALGGIYGTQIASGKLDLFQSLFGIPFLIGSVIFWSLALMSVAGKWTLTVRGDEAESFVGVGPIGLRRRFQWSQVKSVSEGIANAGRRGGTATIYLEGATRVQFATGTSEARRYFVLHALRSKLRGSRPFW